jgi:hypothetical protein
MAEMLNLQQEKYEAAGIHVRDSDTGRILILLTMRHPAALVFKIL